ILSPILSFFILSRFAASLLFRTARVLRRGALLLAYRPPFLHGRSLPRLFLLCTLPRRTAFRLFPPAGILPGRGLPRAALRRRGAALQRLFAEHVFHSAFRRRTAFRRAFASEPFDVYLQYVLHAADRPVKEEEKERTACPDDEEDPVPD